MMGDKKNIDRIFQEKFKDYEVFPEAHVWKGIEKELVKKRERRIVPLWLRFAGAAAILITVVSVGSRFYNNNDIKNNSPNTITNSDNSEENKDKNSKKEEQLLDKENVNKQLNGVATEKTLITTKQKPDQQNSTIPRITQKEERIQNVFNNKINNNVEVADNQQNIKEQQQDKNRNHFENAKQQEVNKENLILTDVEKPIKSQKKDILEELHEQNTIEEFRKNINKWSIGSTAGPVYMNSLEGSPIDPSLVDNSKNSKGSLTYGVKVNYKLSDKFSLQSGIQNIDLAYSTSNVKVIVSSSLLNQSNTSNINFNIKGASAQVFSSDAHITQAIEVSQIPFRKKSPFNNSGNLYQKLSYVEVPLEAKYTLVQKKLGVNLVGGFSTYFLYGNTISISSSGKSIPLGEASNVNDINFSGNVGLDLEYNISPNLFINTSPMLKYQLNTYSKNSGGFKPYFFGIYAGLNYRF